MTFRACTCERIVWVGRLLYSLSELFVISKIGSQSLPGNPGGIRASQQRR